MNLTKHKKWVKDYLKENYGLALVFSTQFEVDNNCNLVVESWDSRISIWKDQVPFMKKDKFCKTVEIGSDRDSTYCHYKFVFPFEYVDKEVNKSAEPEANTNEIILKLREAITFATGRLDIVSHTNEGKLCVEVRDYLLNVLKETEQNG